MGRSKNADADQKLHNPRSDQSIQCENKVKDILRAMLARNTAAFENRLFSYKGSCDGRNNQYTVIL